LRLWEIVAVRAEGMKRERGKGRERESDQGCSWRTMWSEIVDGW
jgi:hypothetical protein